MTRTVGHLFAGIDGFGLGLGSLYSVNGGANLLPAFATAWTIEYADFPRSILQQREPDAEHLTDVLEVHNPPKVDVLTGGFPCQDLSLAGKGAGIRGRRSGLWGQYARIIGEVEPELVLIENVPALLHRGFELVVRDLVALGYRVEWDCLPAAAFGAPHLRDRVWIAAHRHDQPLIFGQPAALFAMLPEGAAELVGADGDDDQAASSWHRWPRAGWVDGDPELVMPLEPLARLSAVKSGWRVPAPIARDWKGTGMEGQLGTVAARGDWPTPRAASNRSSRKAMLSSTDGARRNGGATSSAPSLEQAVELAEGVIPRELDGIDPADLPPATRALWPTPVASDSNGSRRATARTDAWASHPGTTLLDAVGQEEGIVWPTPKASPSGPDFARAGRDGSGGDDLATAVARLLPTPRASDGDARNRGDLIAHAKERPNSHHPGERPEGRDDERRAGALNPVWVEWLMGFPLGWTDPTVANDDLVAAPWHDGEPAGVPRVSAGTPIRRDRLTALGNALVPAAPAWLGGRYLAATDRPQEP